MHRRDFLAATAVAGAAPLARSLAPLETLDAAAERQFIEIRRYQLLPGARQRAFVDFIGGAAIPAMNRAGVSKVGAFTVMRAAAGGRWCRRRWPGRRRRR